MNINTKALKAVVDEIEASRARQKGETEFQREALKRAVKNHQLDAKAIRIVLQRRAMGETKRDEQDYYVHAYELALGGKKAALEALEQGATVREAAKVGGISTGAAGNLAKSVQKSSFVDSEPNPQPDAPAPITESCGGQLSDLASQALEATASEGAGGHGGLREGTDAVSTSRRGHTSGDFAEPAVTNVASRCEPGPQDLTLPPFLDRRPHA